MQKLDYGGLVIINQVKKGLKVLRASQPFNRIATSTLRTAMSLTGVESEVVIKHLHRIDLVESELPNKRVLRLRSRGDDWVSNQVFWRGWQGYESETVPLFFQMAQRARTTFDVGAYVGFFSLLAGHANSEGQVYAFEALSSIYQRLEQNVNLNELHNVRCICSAVGEKEGTAEFFHTASELPTSSSLSLEFMSHTENLVSDSVPIITLDSFVKENNIKYVDLMKIDTESTEPDVIKGMYETLQRDQPTIFCEVLKGRGSEKPLEELMHALGYRFYLLTPEGPIEQKHIEGHHEWLNYLFTKLNPEEIAEFQAS